MTYFSPVCLSSSLSVISLTVMVLMNKKHKEVDARIVLSRGFCTQINLWKGDEEVLIKSKSWAVEDTDVLNKLWLIITAWSILTDCTCVLQFQIWMCCICWILIKFSLFPFPLWPPSHASPFPLPWPAPCLMRRIKLRSIVGSRR